MYIQSHTHRLAKCDEEGGLSCPFLKIEKKCHGFIRLWVKFFIQN